MYEDARQSRLGTEKFMLDGRHTGTGGGNHVVLGGPTPARQPVFAAARFAPLAVGVLAQSSVAELSVQRDVRRADQPGAAVDEARHDAVYELEIAFDEVDRQMRETAQTRRRGWSIASFAICWST